MKRNKTNCKHLRAFPTIVAKVAGWVWCPECGAYRMIEIVSGNAYKNSHRGWIYPSGYDDVLKQIKQKENNAES